MIWMICFGDTFFSCFLLDIVQRRWHGINNMGGNIGNLYLHLNKARVIRDSFSDSFQSNF